VTATSAASRPGWCGVRLKEAWYLISRFGLLNQFLAKGGEFLEEEAKKKRPENSPPLAGVALMRARDTFPC
jgi:hypothetical protein